MPLGRHLFRNQRTVALDKSPASADRIETSLADELRKRLEAAGERDLVAAVEELRVVERCTCDDPRCESFYALPRFQAIWLWNRGGRTIPLGGGLTADAVGDRIVAVEVVRDSEER
jgi:hypothetical protein